MEKILQTIKLFVLPLFNSAPKGQNGKPITKERNLLGGTCKGTKTKEFLTTKVGYATVGDVYLDPGRYDRIKNLEAKKKFDAANEKAPFRPSDRYKTKLIHYP